MQKSKRYILLQLCRYGIKFGLVLGFLLFNRRMGKKVGFFFLVVNVNSFTFNVNSRKFKMFYAGLKKNYTLM